MLHEQCQRRLWMARFVASWYFHDSWMVKKCTLFNDVQQEPFRSLPVGDFWIFIFPESELTPWNRSFEQMINSDAEACFCQLIVNQYLIISSTVSFVLQRFPLFQPRSPLFVERCVLVDDGGSNRQCLTVCGHWDGAVTGGAHYTAFHFLISFHHRRMGESEPASPSGWYDDHRRIHRFYKPLRTRCFAAVMRHRKDRAFQFVPGSENQLVFPPGLYIPYW